MLTRVISTSSLLPVVLALAVSTALPDIAAAQQEDSKSFFDGFERFDRGRWYVSDGWANGDWQNCTWSSRQLKLGEGELTLAFEARPYKDRDYSCAEIQTHERFSYGIYEARMRTGSGSGLNAAFFTYIGPVDNQPHDEIDFEVLTRDTSRVSLNTYVGGQPRHGAEVEVPGGTEDDFVHYAFVWEEDRIRWYVNGELVHEAAGTDTLPSHPQKIFFSLWGSDTLTDWMGPFEDPGRVEMTVDWVAFTELGEDCHFPESVACDLE